MASEAIGLASPSKLPFEDPIGSDTSLNERNRLRLALWPAAANDKIWDPLSQLDAIEEHGRSVNRRLPLIPLDPADDSLHCDSNPEAEASAKNQQRLELDRHARFARERLNVLNEEFVGPNQSDNGPNTLRRPRRPESLVLIPPSAQSEEQKDIMKRERLRILRREKTLKKRALGTVKFEIGPDGCFEDDKAESLQIQSREELQGSDGNPTYTLEHVSITSNQSNGSYQSLSHLRYTRSDAGSQKHEKELKNKGENDLFGSPPSSRENENSDKILPRSPTRRCLYTTDGDTGHLGRSPSVKEFPEQPFLRGRSSSLPALLPVSTPTHTTSAVDKIFRRLDALHHARASCAESITLPWSLKGDIFPSRRLSNLNNRPSASQPTHHQASSHEERKAASDKVDSETSQSANNKTSTSQTSSEQNSTLPKLRGQSKILSDKSIGPVIPRLGMGLETNHADEAVKISTTYADGRLVALQAEDHVVSRLQAPKSFHEILPEAPINNEKSDWMSEVADEAMDDECLFEEDSKITRMENKIVRLRWRCSCDHQFKIDVFEHKAGAAAEIIKAFDQSNGSGSVEVCRPKRLYWWSNWVQRKFGISGRTIDPDVLPTTCPQSSQTLPISHDCTNLKPPDPERYICVCFPGLTYKKYLHHIDVNKARTDPELFLAMRQKYFDWKPLWKRILTFQYLARVEYFEVEVDGRQFKIYCKNLVTIKEDWRDRFPRGHAHGEWVYQPSSRDTTPYLIDDVLTHYVHNPSCAKAGNYFWNRIPKKVHQQLACPDDMPFKVGWGLYFIEEFSQLYLLLILLPVMLFSILLAIWYCYEYGKSFADGANVVSGFAVVVMYFFSVAQGWGKQKAIL